MNSSSFGQWVVHHPWRIIILSLLATVMAASGMRLLQFTTDYRVYFSKDNPQLQAFNELEKVYTKNDNLLIVVKPHDREVFKPRTLAAVKWLTERAWQAPYSIRVDSLSNFQHSHADGDDLIVENLVPDTPNLSADDIERIKHIALNEPLISNRLVSQNGDVTAVNITLQLPGAAPMEEVPAVANFGRELAKELRIAYPDIDVYLSGMAMFNNAFTEASERDSATLVPLSFLVMLIGISILLRGVSGTSATIAVILSSIMVALGIGGYLGIPLTPASVSSPTIILTIAIAGSIHILVTFFQHLRHGESKTQAMSESLRVNLQPVMLTAITTALGFLSMNFSDSPPFRHLGNLVAMGITASFFFSVLLMPALMMVLPVRVKPAQKKSIIYIDHLANFVIRRRRWLLTVMGAVVLVLITFIPKNELNDVFLHYFDEDIQFRNDADFVDANLGGLNLFEYSLRSQAPGGISEPAFLQQVENFSQWFRTQPEVIYVNSLTDTLKRLNMNMHSDDSTWYRLPEQRELAAQYLLLYEMSLPYGLDLNNQVNVDKSALRFSVAVKTLSSNEFQALDQRAQTWLASNAPELLSAGSGPTLMFAHIGKRNINSMLFGTTVALLLISLCLILALRSFKLGLLSMVPNLAPAAMGFGLWGLLIGEVGLGLSVVASMTLGIVVDDTVHFLSKYQRARREKGYGAEQAVHYAFHTVGTAMVITSVVLVAGFLVLSMSSFYLNAGMGLLTAIVIIFALLADFLLLPPLLITIEEKHDEETLLDTDTAVESGNA